MHALGQIVAMAALVHLSTGFVAGPRAFAADLDKSEWVTSHGAAARLIAGGTAPGGGAALLAGLEIRLDPGTITYWRTPGDAGVAPHFDTAGSDNVVRVTVGYPAPRRLDEAGSEAFGYVDDVVFPLTVTRADPRRPATLVVNLDYAICAAQCLPASAALRLQLPESVTADAKAAVDDALDRVPRPQPLGAAAEPSIEQIAADGPDRFRVVTRAGAGAALFVEAPDEWYFDVTGPEAQPDGRHFAVKVAQRPKDASLDGLALTLTLVDGAKAIEVEANVAKVAPAP